MLRFKKNDGSDYPEWEEKKMGEITPLQRGFDLPTSEIVDGEYPVVYSNGIGAYHSEYKCEGEAIITGRSGTIGNFTYLPFCKYWPHNTSLWVTDFCGNFPKYLYYFYQTIRIERFSTGSGVPTLNRNNVHEMKVKVPCIEEQKKISTFFSCVDEVISAIESEVALWEEKKKGVMQKIFSQEVRFKKEDGSYYPEWEGRNFYDVFDLLKNNTFSRAELNYEKGKAKNIHYGDVLIKFPCLLDVEDISVPYVTNDEMVEKQMINALKDGDVIIADTAEDETVGKAIEIYNIGDNKVLSGLHTIPIRAKKNIFSIGYLGYFINTELYHNQLRPLMQGIKVTSISKSALSETTIYYPCIEEQKKIVDCLSKIDDVLKIKKSKLDAWKTIKKGLLQQMFV